MKTLTVQQMLADYLTSSIKSEVSVYLDARTRIDYVKHSLVKVILDLNLIEYNNIFEERIDNLDVTVLTLWDKQKPEHYIRCVMCMGVITGMTIDIEFDEDTCEKIYKLCSVVRML